MLKKVILSMFWFVILYFAIGFTLGAIATAMTQRATPQESLAAYRVVGPYVSLASAVLALVSAVFGVVKGVLPLARKHNGMKG